MPSNIYRPICTSYPLAFSSVKTSRKERQRSEQNAWYNVEWKIIRASSVYNTRLSAKGSDLSGGRVSYSWLLRTSAVTYNDALSLISNPIHARTLNTSREDIIGFDFRRKTKLEWHDCLAVHVWGRFRESKNIDIIYRLQDFSRFSSFPRE